MAKTDESQAREAGIAILVVEDSPTQAERLRSLLAENGFDVAVASNGAEALVAARRRAPALVISDIVMPEMDGYALCKAVKSDAGLAETPVVLLTSLSSSLDVVKGLECGADNFIRKPYDDAYLLSRMRHVLANRELRKTQRMQMGIEIELGGQRHFITSERQQILDLLLSTYEQAVQVNDELIQKEKEARELADARAQLLAELEQKNRDLEGVNKELEAFSYSVSHDLRAPLRSIDGFSQVLLDYADRLDEDGKRHLRHVCESAQQMAEMIDGLLALSRVTRSELRWGRVDLSRLARDAARRLEDGAAESGRRVDFVAKDGMHAYGDARLLALVLQNLIGNSWKFTSKRSSARIEFGQLLQDGRPAFFVRDNGAGFDMAYAGKLFGAFQRLHAASEFEGHGIGLATVERIVRRHGGRVWAEAEVDRGATVYFTLAEGHT